MYAVEIEERLRVFSVVKWTNFSFYDYVSQFFFCSYVTSWFNGFSISGMKKLKVFATIFAPFVRIAVVILLWSLRLIKKTQLKYFSPNHFPQTHEITTCEKCCTQTTQNSMAPHNRRWSISTIFFMQCSNFSTTFQIDLIYREAKMHSRVRAKCIYKCNFCFEEIPGFYSKNTKLVSMDFIQDIQFWYGYSFWKYRWHRNERRT